MKTQTKWDKGLLFFGALYIVISTPMLHGWYVGKLEMFTTGNFISLGLMLICAILCFWLAKPRR